MNISKARQLNTITMKQFFEDIAPGTARMVSDLTEGRTLKTPRIDLYCSSDICDGNRNFEKPGTIEVKIEKENYVFVKYLCGNCKKAFKTYAVIAIPEKTSGAGIIMKYGEFPAFGPSIPAKAIKLIGPEKDLFLLGRRAESQGMGIGAFTYYRRVVENQKNRIFDEIIRVTKKLNPGDPVLEDLEKAKNETQFTRSVDQIKHTLPQSLLINGYNPLTLLHSALSEGVHKKSDEECLELATSIRTLLSEFAIRTNHALKESKELSAAINRLAKERKRK